MHVYLERDVELVDAQGLIVRKPLGVLNHRGEAGPGDDPESYKRLMEKRGLRVHLSPSFLGETIAAEDLAREA